MGHPRDATATALAPDWTTGFRMNALVEVGSPRAWLGEFRLTRLLLDVGKPLYSYHVNPKEYSELQSVLQKHASKALSPAYRQTWSACFCLFVAETFRRTYDAQDGGWSWVGFEKALGTSFTAPQRAELVEFGLKYWKRPVRTRAGGRDLLGSLFAEGGIPWPLVQSETHGFGRAVRRGLNSYYRTMDSGRTTASTIAEYEQYLPQTFRDLETRQLLAGIVDQLMMLADRNPALKDQADPAAYLDDKMGEWRSEFPIPLDVENGRALINDWLKDAGRTRQERKDAVAKALEFTCAHQLIESDGSWKISSEIVLPRTTRLALDTSSLRSTRFELAFYEGDRLLARGGAIYGQVEESGLVVRFPSLLVTLERRRADASLSVRLLDNGQALQSIPVIDSSLEQDQPWVFGRNGDEWRYVASETCSVESNVARIRIPTNVHILDGSAVEVRHEADEARWVECRKSLTLGSDENLIFIQVGARSLSPSMRLIGSFANLDALPSLVFRGLPTVAFPEGYESTDTTLRHFINRKPKAAVGTRDRVGSIHYQVKNVSGQTVFQRKFGVVPQGFELAAYPATPSSRPKLIIRGIDAEHLSARGDGVSVSRTLAERGVVLELDHNPNVKPDELILEVRGITAENPLSIRIPFPFEGARILGLEGRAIEKRDFTMDELIGLRLVLSSGQSRQRFSIELRLQTRAAQPIKRYYSVEAGREPVVFSLFSYIDDIRQMMGAVRNQDSSVEVLIESDRPLLKFNVRRYQGRIVKEPAGTFRVEEYFRSESPHYTRAKAMLLSDPKRQPIELDALTSDGVPVGSFAVPAGLHHDAPWLIYPPPNSGVFFRPIVFANYESLEDAGTAEVVSLHQAAKLFDPQNNLSVIDNQIAEMANCLSHSGWQYLADLKANFWHLPLSTFEAWRSLSKNSVALAVSVLKLELDESFCWRIRDELAVIWESIPLPVWKERINTYKQWLSQEGVPDALARQVLQNRRIVLPAVISGFEFVADFLVPGDQRELRSIHPSLVLPGWYQDLRRRHAANDHWPTELGSSLSRWVRQKEELAEISDLSLAGFTHAVTYAPIFMGYVTADKASLAELHGGYEFVKFAIRLLSDFDRKSWYEPVHTLMVSHLLAKK